ncbi:MAG: hypothetical protein Q7T10_02640 [Rhodoferax sp.]|uniref:hypothetical protein n=1 Tax=Rhodoferax sp. TaxID=50421 RepID=UPI00271B2854|nr:hypothetical protein [Rhodoferax sp.]MDO8447683.1 hypothetical protein [Rhodoferax sp.]
MRRLLALEDEPVYEAALNGGSGQSRVLALFAARVDVGGHYLLWHGFLTVGLHGAR